MIYFNQVRQNDKRLTQFVRVARSQNSRKASIYKGSQGLGKSNEVLEKVVFVQESSKVPRDKLKKAAAVGGSVRWWFGSQGPAHAPDQVDRRTPRPLYIYTIPAVFNPLTTLKIKRAV